MNPTISIVMATYNGERYLREQLDSILAQTVQDFEVVVCDDRSTDGTWNILSEYASKDKRFRINKNEKNLGVQGNFAKGISMVSESSIYIAPCDQDDIWMPDHLERLRNIIGDKVLASGNSLVFEESGKEIGTLAHQDSFDYVPKDSIKQAMRLFLFYNPYQGTAMLGRRDFVQKAMPIPDGIGYHDCWLAAAACMHGGIAYTFVPILKYRRTSASLTGERAQRLSKFWHWRIHWLLPSRKLLAEKLLERYPNLPEREQRFLHQVIRMVERNGTKWGKILNGLYKLRHYRSVYSCKGFNII